MKYAVEWAQLLLYSYVYMYSMALVHERTIPAERPPLVGQINIYTTFHKYRFRLSKVDGGYTDTQEEKA
jgi:hypothetical protein